MQYSEAAHAVNSNSKPANSAAWRALVAFKSRKWIFIGLVRTYFPSGITQHGHSWRDILGNDRSDTHHRAFADGDARKDCRVGAYGRAFLDEGRQECCCRIARARVEVVSKRYIWTDKDAVLERDSVPKLDTTFDRHTVTDDDLVLDEAVRADVSVATNYGSWQDHHVLPDPGSLANLFRLNI